MPEETRIVSPGHNTETVRFDSGELHTMPAGWQLLPPGDAGLTRRVKAAGPTWTIKESRGRKVFSRGLWAPAAHVETARRRLAVEREDPAYQRRLDAGKRRRDAEQVTNVQDFEAAIVGFLAFAPQYSALAEQLATLVAAHATPVGSGTVARTQRIPLQERAEAAVMAWMRHQTTDYDHRVIAREKGKRREVRRDLAKASRRVLAPYRAGQPSPAGCPLLRAIERPGRSTAVPTGKLATRPVLPTTSTAPRPAAPTRPLSATFVQKKAASAGRWGTIARLKTAPEE